jgi:hypothetical protein
MFSGLKIKVQGKYLDNRSFTVEKSFSAFQLLAMLQQALPGMEKPAGDGALASVWKPKTAEEWFYCAKVCAAAQRTYLGTSGGDSEDMQNLATPVKTDGKAWIEVGGRFMRVDVDNLYSSDCGPTPADTSVEPSVASANPTYPTLLGQIRTALRTRRGDLLVADVRALLERKLPIPGTKVLAVLTNVLFVSEVARNHTAFHVNQMALDLLTVGYKNNTSMDPATNEPLTWTMALWLPEAACTTCRGSGNSNVTCAECRGSRGVACDKCGGTGRFNLRSACNKCGGDGRFKLCATCNKVCTNNGKCRTDRCRCNPQPARCASCSGSGKKPCTPCRGKGISSESSPLGRTGNTASGGLASLQAGLLPMSHTGSAWGSAYDLSGEGSYFGVNPNNAEFDALHPLTVVRRKEATLLIRWLSLALGGYKNILGANPALFVKCGLKNVTITTQILKQDFTADSALGETVYDAQEQWLEDQLGAEAKAAELTEELRATRRDLNMLESSIRRMTPREGALAPPGSAAQNEVREQLRKAAEELAKTATELEKDLATLKTHGLCDLLVLALVQKRVDSFEQLLA